MLYLGYVDFVDLGGDGDLLHVRTWYSTNDGAAVTPP